MKKIYIIPLALFFLSTMTSNIFAADYKGTEGGAAITITATNTDGSDITFDPSPNTIIGANVIAAEFAVNAISEAALASGDAIEYGMAFDTNQVIKTERAKDYAFVAPTGTDSAAIKN